MPVVRGRDSAFLWRSVSQEQNVSDDLAVVMTIECGEGSAPFLGVWMKMLRGR